jgi:hypothetical protein
MEGLHMKYAHQFLVTTVSLITIGALLTVPLPVGAHQITEGSDEDVERQQMEQVLHYAEQVNEINAGLAGTAKALAKALSDKKFRQFVRQQTVRSRNAEQILEAKAFFQKALRTNRSAPGLQELQRRVLKLSAQVKEAGLKLSEETGEVDIYFPVVAHRKRWRGDDNLLVAFVPLADDMSLREIYAWSVKDQKWVSIDAKEPPETPTLVIALTEKETYATRKPPPPTDVGSVKGPEPKGKPKSDNSYFGASYIKMFDDREPWFKGDPEIYAYHIQLGAPGWNNKHGYGPCQVSYKDFYWINNELYNYYVWSYMGRYFDSRYSDDTRIIFRERDSGPRTMEIVAISKHSQQEWELNVNDDDVRVCTYEGGRAAGIFNDDDDSITSTNWRPASWKSNYSFGPDHEVPAVHNDLWIRKEH